SSNHDTQLQGAGRGGESGRVFELHKSTRWCLFINTAPKPIGLMSVTVFPVRLLLVSFFMLLAWPFAFTASLGRSELVPDPQSWWRRIIDLCLRVIMRAMWFCGGFHWIKVKGERAPPSEVPILTVAPHSSYFDAIPVTMTMCSIVAKLESQSVPVWGTLISYIRPVLVFRSDQHSRRKTVEEIKRRAQSGGKWPQIMIFPEGTCTNRSGLILFKAGAFIPGLPVQPVVLRYSNKLDTISWTWRGPGRQFSWCAAITLRLTSSHCFLQYLPIYHPSAKERENPALFASNVRRLMAEALEVPLTDLSFDDRDIILSHGPLRIHDYTSLLHFNQLLGQLGAVNASQMCCTSYGKIDVRHYVTALSTVQRPQKPLDTLKLAFQLYEEDSGGVTGDDLAVILEIMLGVKEVELAPLFLELEAQHTAKITYGKTLSFSALQMIYFTLCGEHTTSSLQSSSHSPASTKVAPENHKKGLNLVMVFRKPSPLILVKEKN
uniref:Lysophosphatidylcholine acyltransferase 1 n=1 Tax=Poecilia reticulata TaxID=8081 RepID=A0A3P9PUX1_POERE